MNMGIETAYRTHTCGGLRATDVGKAVRLAGWVHRRRDHGSLLFLDLRDHFGVTQCVVTPDNAAFGVAEHVRLESVVAIRGRVTARSEDTVNPHLATGQVEVTIEAIDVLSAADVLPLQLWGAQEPPEDLRLRYRFLDLRRERLHGNMVLRSGVIASVRRRMVEQGFSEMQTPILTSSSPEGARDYLVPSRLHPGKFYALPQAPQQFKQLLMVAGFDRYFQIAPCFRDEDARADRSPGEFYQLDVEMSFVEQADVFAAVEPVLYGLFSEFSQWAITPPPFPRIPYAETMLRYGSDKPDLRNPIFIADVTDTFAGSGFAMFAKAIEDGAVVRAMGAPGAAARPRSFFDRLVEFARSLGLPGLAYVIVDREMKGPIAKFLTVEMCAALSRATGARQGDAIFFVCGEAGAVPRACHAIRGRLGEDLDVIEKSAFRFCWITDYPFYERDDVSGAIVFSHNPFSMPQGGLEALETLDPLDIRAYQYDIVCNGIELSSGAIRNHRPEVMIRAFEIAGYRREDVEERFGGLLNAFRYGAPPHGGLAPGIDRMVMLLANEANIREVIVFPMNQAAQDLMMNAPSTVNERQLRELHIQLALPPDREEKVRG